MQRSQLVKASKRKPARYTMPEALPPNSEQLEKKHHSPSTWKDQNIKKQRMTASMI